MKQKLNKQYHTHIPMCPKTHKKCNDDAGIILVTVIILTLVLMIVTIGIISSHYSQVIYSGHQIDRIKAEELARGIAWYNYINKSYPAASTPPPDQVTLDGKTYNLDIIETPGAGPDGSDQYNITVDH